MEFDEKRVHLLINMIWNQYETSKSCKFYLRARDTDILEYITTFLKEQRNFKGTITSERIGDALVCLML